MASIKTPDEHATRDAENSGATVLKHRKDYAQVERRMVTEFVEAHYPTAERHYNIRLGSEAALLPTNYEGEVPSTVFRNWLPRADAIAIEPQRVVIIEGMVTPNPHKWAQLITYKLAFTLTPQFRQHRDKPIQLILLYAIEERWALLLAAQHGIKCIYYAPDYVLQSTNYVSATSK